MRPQLVVGDDGAPLDGERVLAMACRWGQQPLTFTHLRPGELGVPCEGLSLQWHDDAPIVSWAPGVRVSMVDAHGALTALKAQQTLLEPEQTLVAELGALVVEARLQRRVAQVTSRARPVSLFPLVVAHTMMVAAALIAIVTLTPSTPEASMWGSPTSTRLRATPTTALPKRPRPELQRKVEATLARVQSLQQATPSLRRNAKSALSALFGGGGPGSFAAGLGTGIDAALEKLGPGSASNLGPGGALGFGSRDLGGGGPGGPGLSLGRLAGGPVGGPPSGLLRKRSEVLHDGPRTVSPGYSRELVMKVVKRHQNEVRFCYESALAQHPSLAGKLTMQWVIDASGATRDVSVAESGLDATEVERCVVERIGRWKFPEPAEGGEVAITFPWVFQVAGSGE